MTWTVLGSVAASSPYVHDWALDLKALSETALLGPSFTCLLTHRFSWMLPGEPEAGHQGEAGMGGRVWPVHTVEGSVGCRGHLLHAEFSRIPGFGQRAHPCPQGHGVSLPLSLSFSLPPASTSPALSLPFSPVDLSASWVPAALLGLGLQQKTEQSPHCVCGQEAPGALCSQPLSLGLWGHSVGMALMGGGQGSISCCRAGTGPP